MCIRTTSEWLDVKLPKGGELNKQEKQELFHRIQLEELPVVLFWDDKYKWSIVLDERECGKPLAECYWLESGFKFSTLAYHWITKKIGQGVNINFHGKIQLKSTLS